MILIFNIVAITCIFLCIGIGLTVAQPHPHSISGHILDNESNYIKGADVILLNERTGDILELQSAINGEYQQDAYNFANHYQNGDIIRYNVTYGSVGAVKTAKIDISKGGTKLDIVLTVEDSPKTTQNPTPRRITITKSSAEMYLDTDGDGVSDNVETLKGSDPKDACDPNPNCAQCDVQRVPKATPEAFSPIIVSPVPIPTPVAITPAPIAQTPRQAPVPSQPTPKQIPGFTTFIGISVLIVVASIKIKRGKSERGRDK